MTALSRFRRTIAVAIVGLVLVVAAGVVADPVAGEESFGVGSGRASAKLLKVGPSRGALTLAPQVGLALSDFLNTRGRGDVRFADFAALADSLPPELITAFPSVKVESTAENAAEGETVTLGTPPEIPVKVAAAELHADAGAEPRGASSFSAGAVDIGIGTIAGGVAASHSGIVDGNTREAVATVVLPRLELAGGAVVLENLRWEATQRSGATETNDAKFSIGSATIAGQTMAAPSGSELPLADVAAALAPVLDPLGIELTFPTPRLDPGSVSLSPLRLRVVASDAAPALIPVTDAIQPVREQLVGGIRGATEDADAAILLSDIALGVITGGSALDIEIGGVSAATAPPAAGFRFGSAGGFQLGAGAASGSAGGFGVTGAPLPTPAAAPASEVGAGQGEASSAGGAAASAEPVSSTAPAERGGPMLAVGLLGIAAAAIAAAADYRKLTHGARTIPA